MMPGALFMTGGTGFVGLRLLERIQTLAYERIYCLVRSLERVPVALTDRTNVSFLRGDLFDAPVYREALAESAAVLHLAAATGRRPPEEYFRVNARGTEFLLDRCRESGVQKFLYVSTVATKFPDKHRYYYAQSKELAERAVRESGLRYTVVRPTLVMGEGAHWWKALSRAAGQPITLLLGDGRASIQPIYVDDLVECLLLILREDRFLDETLDLGGPERLSMEEFLRRIHRLRRGREPRVIHVPLDPVLRVLSFLEGPLYSLLPMTVGQLSSFRHDGTAEPNGIWSRQKPRMRSVSEMLATVLRHE